VAQRVAVVIGATSDIGAAIARALADDGAAIAVHFHSDQESAQRLAEELTATGARAETVGADVSVLEDVQAMAASVQDVLGPPAILVNTAADVRFERFLDSDPGQWSRQIGVTLIGAMNLLWVFGAGMVQRRDGRLISILAEGALIGEPALGVASATKGGVLGLTRALAKDFAPHGVTVNGVSPGFVPTKAVPERFRSPERLESIAKHYPAGRLGTAQDIAQAVAFLASREASYVTGQTLSVSGGYSVR
jgi:NAD(P)-dependent dehydrogenase (short-subunit alcohol dehydrogenase family)